MDFCHLIVTCLFSMLRLPFDNQKVKGNYAILLPIFRVFSIGMPGLSGVDSGRFGSKCRGIGRYDNPFVPALIHYDAKQDKGMLS